MLKGVRRVKGDAVKQKLPATIDLLLKIFLTLNLDVSFDRVFWAVCVIAFLSFSRLANLLIPSREPFDPCHHLCLHDMEFALSGTVLSVKWSKVIQFKQRVLQINVKTIAFGNKEHTTDKKMGVSVLLRLFLAVIKFATLLTPSSVYMSRTPFSKIPQWAQRK